MGDCQQNALPLAILAAAIAAVLLLFVMQVVRLRDKHGTAALLLPMCRTIADMLEASRERASLLRALENSRFRSVWLTVFSDEGEVWADNFSSAVGQLPMPASQSQRDAYERLKSAKVDPRGVRTVRFGSCPLGAADRTIYMAGVQIGSMIVCMQTTGDENF